jgi:nucleotide-binding universal stress UspA family protein
MYQKILVPLDGSELAECVLPHVQSIARGCGVKDVVFLRIVEPVYLTSPDEIIGFSGDAMEKLNASRKETAEKYLAEVVRKTKLDGAGITTEAMIGRAMDDITDYAKKIGADLITIATHGRSGISRWVWGSVADRVLRSACVPVLMVRPKGCLPGI